MNLLRLKTLPQVLCTFICVLFGFMPMGVAAYTFDENLPDYLSSFKQLDPGYYILTNFHRNPNAGASTFYFPSAWQNLSAGQDLRVKVLLPPGTDAATLYIEAASMSAYIGACDGVSTVCSTALGRAALSLWPNPPFGGGTLTPLTSPRIVSFVVQAKDNPFDFSTMTITYHIADATLYENWRQVRSWAGGNGDCDGLGNAYCNGVTPNAAVAPPLGNAQSFAVLGGSGVTNTGLSVVTGDMGSSPTSTITGFPPGKVATGTMVAVAVAAAAQTDITTAYNALAGQVGTTDLTGQDLGNRTLSAGVYSFSTSAQLTGTVTLDAKNDPNAVFIFKMGSTLATASNSKVNVINGGQSCNVFWQVGSSATLGTHTTFAGNILAQTSITLNTGASVNGRALAGTGAVTMDSNAVTVCSLAAVTPTPNCVAPQVLQSGQCVTPTPNCVAPQVLQSGQCVTPTLTCVAPQVLQNGQCVTPTASLSLTSMGISKLTSTSVAITATVNGAATGYYVVLSASAEQPNCQQVVAGTGANNSKVGVIAANKSAATSTAGDIALPDIAGLTAATSYQIFVCAQDTSAAKQSTAVFPIKITTNVAAVATPASIVGTPSGDISKRNLEVTLTPLPNAFALVSNYYVLASVPKWGWYSLTNDGMEGWKAGALLPFRGTVTSGNTIQILKSVDMTVEDLLGTEIYAGFLIGDDLVLKKLSY